MSGKVSGDGGAYMSLTVKAAFWDEPHSSTDGNKTKGSREFPGDEGSKMREQGAIFVVFGAAYSS